MRGGPAFLLTQGVGPLRVYGGESVTWFKVDDQLADHPKVMGLGDDRLSALGLWTICGTYSAKHLTDGFVPQSAVQLYGGPRWQRIVDALVRVGLLEAVSGGYRMHDFLDYNPSRQKVNDDRSKKRAAGQAGGQASAQARAQASAAPDGSEVDQPPSRTRPVPVPEYVQTYIDPLALYSEKVGRRPGVKERAWIEDLQARFSTTEVVRGMQAVEKGSGFLARLDAYMEGRAA